MWTSPSFATLGVRAVIHKTRNKVSKSWWDSTRSHLPRLCRLDPNLRFRVLSNVSRQPKIAFHRLSLGVSYTREYLSISGFLSRRRTVEKLELQNGLLHLDNGTFPVENILGSWDSADDFAESTKPLKNFLVDTGLVWMLQSDNTLKVECSAWMHLTRKCYCYKTSAEQSIILRIMSDDCISVGNTACIYFLTGYLVCKKSTPQVWFMRRAE